MSTLKKCGRLSPLAHRDCLSAAGILALPTSSIRAAHDALLRRSEAGRARRRKQRPRQNNREPTWGKEPRAQVLTRETGAVFGRGDHSSA